MAESAGRTICVTSGKGGVGKTTVAAGLSSCLAAMGHKVICVDADVGARNLDIALGLVGFEQSLDLADALHCRAAPLECLTVHPRVPNLRLLPAPVTETYRALPTERFAPLISHLALMADFVVVDSPAGLQEGFGLCVSACKEAILVAAPDAECLRVASLAAGSITEGRLVVNRVKPRAIARDCAPDIDRFIDSTGLQLLGLIPEDEMVPAAAHRGHALVFASHNGAILAMLHIARRMLGEKLPQRRLRVWRVSG
jgi:septum site-determining protein MinD